MHLSDRTHAARRSAESRGRRVARTAAGDREGPTWVGALLIGGVAAAFGAIAAFLMDPSRGHARRVRLVDQGGATVRRSARWVERAARTARASATGAMAAASHAGSRGATDLDDATLAGKVESELFRDPSVPKGTINVNVERGIAVLRGEVPTAEMRDHLARAAERIGGVWSVRNLLHLPGEPAGEELLPAGIER